MCTISHQLKLCTCKNVLVKEPNNYWILYRQRDTNMEIMGTILQPEDGYENNELKLMNTHTILTALNNGTCFDFPIHIKESNILNLHFTVPATNQHAEQSFIHEFVYTNGKWISTSFTPFNAAKHTKRKGKINHAFTR